MSKSNAAIKLAEALLESIDSTGRPEFFREIEIIFANAIVELHAENERLKEDACRCRCCKPVLNIGSLGIKNE